METTTPHNPALDPQIRKKVLRMIPYGLYVITSRHESKIAAATIDWVTQSSFEPPMVTCCLRKDSLIYEVVMAARKYVIHPLGEGQKDYSTHFFKNKEATATHINGQSYQANSRGMPVLDEPPAWFELELVDQLTQSDHAVVLGRVVEVHLRKETPSLLLRDTGWHYGG